MLRRWDSLPKFMRTREVRPYWEILDEKRSQLILKRMFDLTGAVFLLLILAIPMCVIAMLIKIEDLGPVMYRQRRVTAYGRVFEIHKFRTMIADAEKIGTSVTIDDDPRITRIGQILREYRLDELPQLFDVIKGDMSFVGTRPESVKYVKQYMPEYYATLLVPAGITSEASIKYKDEEVLLKGVDDVDRVYIDMVLPEKMKWNLRSIRQFSLLCEIKTMIRTIVAVCIQN